MTLRSTSYRLDESTLSRLEQLAELERRSKTDVLRLAVETRANRAGIRPTAPPIRNKGGRRG